MTLCEPCVSTSLLPKVMSMVVVNGGNHYKGHEWESVKGDLLVLTLLSLKTFRLNRK